MSIILFSLAQLNYILIIQIINRDLKSLKQYPIINAITYSYIFYDKIPGLEGIYKQKDFYFKVDPFTYENIDHYTIKDMNLSGEFVGGNILKPMKQYLVLFRKITLWV